MAQIKVDTAKLDSESQKLEQIGNKAGNYAESIDEVIRQLNSLSSTSSIGSVQKSLKSYSKKLESEKKNILKLSVSLKQISKSYAQTEKKITGAKAVKRASVSFAAGETAKTYGESSGTEQESDGDYLGDVDLGNFGNVIATIIGAKDNKTWYDWAKTGKDAAFLAADITKDISHYARVGSCFGTGKTVFYFLRNELGFNTKGYLAKSFTNNLFGKSSPYSLRNAFSSFTGKSGAVSAVASWTGVALSGVTNAYKNIQEQKETGMSTGRVVAETITETVIDTAGHAIVGAVVGSAIATVAPVAAVPLVVGVATAGVFAVADGVSNALWEKSATEAVSDAVLDIGETVAKAVGSGIKNGAKAVSGWFSSLSGSSGKAAFSW